ncbi:MAG: DegV family EDD domain-containing protein [Anaerolineae bacterium]|nr:DegV family EDD domain-containing protein [Anaerolineae bacterium]NIN94067.1 DegV family EDD domain-containing protein [Anaerolineae bacterium]NIQ77108.1 DegV family EDD domain-containing protein [Anaerolineae bacterium]
MGRVRVVTDSTAELSYDMAEDLGITVIPLNLHIGRERFRDGIDINHDEFFEKLENSESLPSTTAPPLELFEDTYRSLGSETDDIISIHISAKLSGTVELARQAATSLIGQRRIAVVDSLTTSLALRTLVLTASTISRKGASLDEVVRMVRAMIPHVYLVFFVEDLEYLERGERIGKAEALLGTMLSIKPLLIIEDGEVLPLEKVRTRSGGVDKLYEFVTEFPHLEKIAILKGANVAAPTDLLDRLRVAYPVQDIDVITYGPVLATHLGPEAIGVFVYEGL